MVLSLKYVQDHALTLGIANVTVCCFLVSHNKDCINEYYVKGVYLD